jgi:hypothetical protein
MTPAMQRQVTAGNIKILRRMVRTCPRRRAWARSVLRQVYGVAK